MIRSGIPAPLPSASTSRSGTRHSMPMHFSDDYILPELPPAAATITWSPTLASTKDEEISIQSERPCRARDAYSWPRTTSEARTYATYGAYMLGAATARYHLEKWHSMSKSDLFQSSSSTSTTSTEIKEVITPFSTFTKKEKIFVVTIASITTLLPPMTSNILYPVIEIVAEDLGVTVAQVNLTITAYLVVQGLAPSFIGNLSDAHGRRPALLASFSVFIAGSLGATFPGSYTVLIVTRCLQAAGSSGTIAIASAIVTDVVTSAQRGSYYSYVQMGAMVGPSLGPVLGGLLTNTWGYRSIFWFLTSFSSILFLIILFFMPETSRGIVRNGSVPAQHWNRPLLRKSSGVAIAHQTARFNPLRSFGLFLQRSNFILLMYAGMLWSTQYYFFTTLSTQFRQNFHFSTIEASLLFLVTGSGTVIAVLLAGRLQDYNFRRHASRLGIEISNDQQQSMDDFPIEKARLQTSFPLILLTIASLVIYGWLLSSGYPDGPIILAFLWAAGYAAAFNCISNLLVDLNRDEPGTVTASLNLSRNWIGAGVVAVANPLTTGIGVGWANVVVAGTLAILFPFVLLVYWRGHDWRKRAEAISSLA